MRITAKNKMTETPI